MKINSNKHSHLFLFAMIMLLAACSKKDQTTAVIVTPPTGGQTISAPTGFGFYVVGYFPSYRDPAAIPDQKFKMCNVVNYAFANVTATGGLTVANPTVLAAVLEA